MERRSATRAKRYPGFASVEGPSLVKRLLWVVYVWFLVSMFFFPLVFEDSWLCLVIIIVMAVAVTPLIWIGSSLYATHTRSEMFRKWGADHYIYEIPIDWPILELLKVAIERLRRHGFFLISTREDRVPEDLKRDFERFMGGYHIMPANRKMFVMSTRGGRLTQDQAIVPVYHIVILPIARPFSEDDDPIVDIVGGVLWDHEVDRLRQGLRSTIPPELL